MKEGRKCRRASFTRLFIVAMIAVLALALIYPVATANMARAAWVEAPSLDREGMFDNPYTSLEEALEVARAKHEEVVNEGTALLKNNGLLPLSSTQTGSNKVTVFNSAPALVEGLEGVGFEVNDISPQTSTSLGQEGSGNQGVITQLNADQLKSIDKYNDVAVVRIFRTAGEANDVSTGRSLTSGLENFGDITWIDEDGKIVDKADWSQADYEAGKYREAWPDGTPKGWNHENLTPNQPKATYTDVANPDKRDTSPVRHGLMMTANEEKMIQLVKEHFDNIVVVYDSITQFELWDLEHDPDIDAIIHSGRMTNTSVNNPSLWAGRGIARVLSGQVNPSAYLVSQWDRDMTADPTWQNFGDNFQMDSSTTYMYSDGTSTGSQTRASVGGGTGLHGVDYEEGIYLGYKYYETYWYETMQGRTEASANATPNSAENVAAADAWHEAHVAFPFGYGLSYTDFKYEIEGVDMVGSATELTDGGTVQGNEFASTAATAAKVKTLNVTVKITNVGDRGGKAVGQIYVTAPYIDGGVEMPYVKLVGFDKTRYLEPGQSDTLVVPVQMQDIASFDYDGRANIADYTGYILNEGEYTLRLMNSSSERLAKEMSEGEASYYDDFSFSIANGGSNVALAQDDFSGNEVEAIFSDPNTREYTIRDNNIMAAGGTEMTIMSRDSEKGGLDGTFPKAPEISDLKLDDNYIDDYVRAELGFVAGYQRDRSETGLTTAKADYALPAVNGANAWYYDAAKGKYDYRDSADDPWFISETEFNELTEGWTQASQSVRDNDTTGAGASIKLREMSGVPLYVNDEVNPEWTEFMNQMTYLELQILASCGNSALARIDAIDKNQSAARDNTSVLSNIYHWGDQPLLSRTWNLDLCADHGEITAQYAAFGKNSPTGWWSPGCNLQRSPFSGRNGDYYGQDAFQAGMIISAVTAAAEENGLACWIKHFVLNDQETNRNGYSLFTWGDEQTFRENYFMYPQKAMQEGGSQGYMQSFARIGGVVFAYSYEANTELVRNQWGWTGIGVTDMLLGHSGNGYGVPATPGNLLEAEALGTTDGKQNNPDQTKDWGVDGGDGRYSSNKPVTLDQLVRGTHGLPDGTQSKSSKFENGAYVNTINCYDAATKTVKVSTDLSKVGNNPASGIWSDTLKGVYLEAESGTTAPAKMTDSGRNQWYHVRMTAMYACYESANSRGNQNGMLVNDNTNQLRNYHNTTLAINDVAQGKAVTASAAITDETYDNSVVYSVVEGVLPAGLTLDSATGVISGTPTAATTEATTVVVECRVANYLYGNKTVTIAPVASAITLSASEATLGKAFSADLACTLEDGDEAVFSVSELPEGLTLADGVISGTPEYVGRYDFTVTATIGRDVYTSVMSVNVAPDSGLTADEVNDLIAQATEGTVTQSEVRALIDAAMSGVLGEDDIQALIDQATDGQLTEADVQALIDAALEKNTEEGGCGSSVSLGVTVIVLLAAALLAGVVLFAVKAKKQR